LRRQYTFSEALALLLAIQSALIAYCERREAVRMFKVDRIQEAMLLDESYSIPNEPTGMCPPGDV